jgi:hypothetical protein
MELSPANKDYSLRKAQSWKMPMERRQAEVQIKTDGTLPMGTNAMLKLSYDVTSLKLVSSGTQISFQQIQRMLKGRTREDTKLKLRKLRPYRLYCSFVNPG